MYWTGKRFRERDMAGGSIYKASDVQMYGICVNVSKLCTCVELSHDV